jgi:hypothetical protein
MWEKTLLVCPRVPRVSYSGSLNLVAAASVQTKTLSMHVLLLGVSWIQHAKQGSSMEELRVIAVNGHLGYGYDFLSLELGMKARPDLLGVDAGSTDAGPYYLGSGDQLAKPNQVYRDLKSALISALRAGAPLIIGSAGTAGGEPHLQSLLDILYRIVREEKLHFRLAVIHAELDKKAVRQAFNAGRVYPMRGVPPLTEDHLDHTVRIVGQMGTQPFITALEGGADVIVAGRSCDAAIFAAQPILKGFDPGLAFHMAKIIECGAQCAIPLAANDSIMSVLRSDHFLIRPLHPSRVVTPASVAAHSLYEQPDPFIFEEPEGTVDISEALFEQLDRHTVRVSGSHFIAREGKPRIKIEGAGLRGYRAVVVAGVRDPSVIANLDAIEAEARHTVEQHLDSQVVSNTYKIYFRYYGRDAVLGPLDSRGHHQPHEVGVLIEVIADTQPLANNLLSLVRSSFLHCPFPGRKTTAGNLAFPFSPSDLVGGPVFEFTVYHLIEVEDPAELFPVEFQGM